MLLILNLSKEERRMYEIYDRNVQDQIAREAYARDEGEKDGEKRGEKRGIELGKLEIAKNLIKKGMSLESISEVSQLSMDQLATII
ncbi:MAG: hypothetical protein FWE07_05635 [Turicibacter sp.]|nr:hypothetical protein [Turicibacter sp.]